MTLDELNQLRYLRKYIRHEQERLEAMRESLDVKSPIISDMPKAHTVSDRIGDTVPSLVDKAVTIQENIIRCTEIEQKLTRFIERVPNFKIRIMMQLRFVDGMSWNEVADYVDNGNGKCTGDSVRMAITTYLNNEGCHEV